MKTADLVDRFADRVTFCDRQFMMLGRRRAFDGRISTVKCFEDNVLLKTVLHEPGQGGVLVVDAGGSTRCAVLGDQLAAILGDNGWAGAIVNGAVRDRDEIDDLDIGIFCLATSPVKSAKTGAGARDVPVTFGNARFEPGGWLYADRDGILVADAKLD